MTKNKITNKINYKKCNHVKFELDLNIDLIWYEGIKNALTKNEKFCILKLMDIDPTFTYFFHLLNAISESCWHYHIHIKIIL